MIVCVSCALEMSCSKTGLGARFGEDHVYSGDEFECLGCGIRVIRTNDQATFDPHHRIETIQMTVKS